MHDLGVVVAHLRGVLGIEMHDVVVERLHGEGGAHQRVVERLRVAFEHVRVALGGRQRLDESAEAGRLQDADGVGELEVVEISEHDDGGARIDGQDLPHEVGHDLRLLPALGLARAWRRLEAAEQRLIAALGVEVIGDDEERAAVPAQLAHQRLTAVGEGRVER
jgi:hypothetical protein